MSTHATPETRHASTTDTTPEETPTGPDIDSEGTTGTADETPDEDDPAPMDPFDTHNAAATFGSSTRRLRNTVDDENAYLGQ